ncbi:MAG TPA: c-type cytochrome biogenesis protein CcsB [Dehalococcoidia bacterium]|nr:c-type cytochrome biogenesis protein CcsB [Dehalococcoidia bacterium]
MTAATYAAVAFGSWTTYRQAQTNAGTLSVPVSISLPGGASRLARLLLYATVVLLTLSVGARAAAVERPPLGNLWEYTVALSWGMVLFTVIFQEAFRERAVALVTLPGAAAMMAVALAFFPSEVRPLVPALQSNRILGLHVTTMVLAYSALSISFGASVLQLVQGGERRRFERLPDVDALSDVAYWSVLVGFPLLTLGIALGAYWANSAWGRYWGWDPKETSALLTWFVYAAYLHARGLRGWEGKRAAWLLIAGYVAVLFTYFAVNFLVSGLHSYAGV